MKKNLRQFNPDKIAELDLHMWQAYYGHNFLKLFILLLKLMHEFFKLDYIHTLQGAFYSAGAAIDFRINKGKENSKRIAKKLTRFFKVISDNSIEKFDYAKAAQLELEWWLIDRYPTRYKITREEGLANAMAVVYNTLPSNLTEYANYRAKAMVLQDEAESTRKEADWSEIGALLKKSFNSLYQSVQ